MNKAHFYRRHFWVRKGYVVLICAAFLCASVIADQSASLLAAAVPIFGSVAPPSAAPAGYPVLDACPGGNTFFPLRLSTDDWRQSYHKTVSDVILQHLTTAEPTDCRAPKGQAGKTDTTMLPYETPSDLLREVAAELSPWQKPEDLDNLHEWDIGSVLLELLRAYECSLKQRERGIVPYVLDQMAAASSASSANAFGAMGTIPVIALKQGEELQKIDLELKIARPALRRTLTALAGQNQLTFLLGPLDCLERASLDIRNELGLAATTSTCLPRIWNARGSLRSLANP